MNDTTSTVEIGSIHFNREMPKGDGALSCGSAWGPISAEAPTGLGVLGETTNSSHGERSQKRNTSSRSVLVSSYPPCPGVGLAYFPRLPDRILQPPDHTLGNARIPPHLEVDSLGPWPYTLGYSESIE